MRSRLDAHSLNAPRAIRAAAFASESEAADAVLFRVASPADVDRAMIKGVGYPKGLLEWADEIGIPGCVGRLAALQGEYGEDRYRASALLRRMARLDQKFYP